MTESQPHTGLAPFRQQTWRTKWLLCGAAFLALWYSVRYLDREWLSRWPVVIVLLVTGLAPHLFLLLFPLFTRDKDSAGRILIPGVKRWLIEFAIAIPIVIVTTITLGALDYLVRVLWPGKTLTPDAVTSMASSSPRLIYPILLFSFTLAPVAEEVFFRGFVYNSLRTRMPASVAGLVQSLIFGFCHFFGTTHAVIAFALGLAITGVYEWRKTLVSPIFVHSGINFLFAVGVLAMMAEYADRPTLGVVGGPNDSACIIRDVIPDSAAFEAGILVEDRIVAVDGQRVGSFPDLVAVISAKQVDDRVTVNLVRKGKSLDIEATLKRRADTRQPP